MDLISKYQIKAMAHITGGGFYDNIPRVIPKGLGCLIDKGSWSIPGIFGLIKSRAHISDKEMFKTYNMGIGMVLVVSKNTAGVILKYISSRGIKSFVIGEIIKSKGVVIDG